MKISQPVVRKVVRVTCAACAFAFMISCTGSGELTETAQSAILSILGGASGGGSSSPNDPTVPEIGIPHGDPAPPGEPISIPQGGPAPSGEPTNAPDLAGFEVESFDFQDYGAGFRANTIQFNLPVHSETIVAVFIGGKSMALLPDNTVVNSLFHLSFTTGQLSGGGTIPPFMADYFGDRKWRMLVVARNEFGSSFKELPVAHARVCAIAQATPVTFGNCGSHCIEATQNGAEIALKAKRSVQQTAYYLALNVGTLLPPQAISPGPAPYEWLERGDPDGTQPISGGPFDVTTSFSTSDYDRLCVLVDSWSYLENGTGEKFIFGFVLVP